MPGSVFYLLTGLLCVLSVLFRWQEIWDHLPYINTYDEFQVWWNSMYMMSNRTPFSNHFFGRGHSSVYVAIFLNLPVLLYLHLSRRRVFGEQLTPEPEYEFSVGYVELLITDRIFWVLLSVSSLWAIALIGQMLVGRWVGLGAAAILAVNPFHAAASSRIEADPFASAVVAWTLFLVLYALKMRSRNLLILSAVGSGLACGAKYNYGSVLVGVVIAQYFVDRHIDSSRRMRIRHQATLVGVFVGVFLATTPSILLFPIDFVRQLGFQVVMYGTSEGFSEPGLGQVIFQLEAFSTSFGALLLALSLLGLLFLFRQKKTRDYAVVIAVSFVPFCVVMLASRVNYHRNWLSMYPILSFLAAVGLWYAIIWVSRRRKKSRDLLIVGLGVYCLTLSCYAVAQARTILTNSNVARDTRSIAMDFAWAKACEVGADVVVDRMLLLNDKDREPQCASSVLVETDLNLVAEQSGDENVLVLCLDESEESVPGVSARDEFLISSNRQTECRGELLGLWNNPPLIDPPIGVYFALPSGGRPGDDG